MSDLKRWMYSDKGMGKSNEPAPVGGIKYWCKWDEAQEQIEQLQAALTELVRLKDLKDYNISTNLRTGEELWENGKAKADYELNKPLAWDAARKVLG